MTYSQDDYLRALQGLLPRGEVWPRDPDATLTQILRAIAASPARLDARASALLVDAFPATSAELLPEWEASLGLPDPCTGPLSTVQQRRAAVVARLTSRGGASIAYFVGVAAALGYTITVEEFAPAIADGLVADGPVNGEDWAYAWLVRAPQTTVTEFAADESFADEPLSTWGNLSLECVLNRIRPAHTILIFAYGS